MKIENLKKLFFGAAVMSLAFSLTSCYEDYLKDYNYSATYFASQKPLRTVIADREMSIKVGAVLAGKRQVDPKDWVDFTIDPTLMEGTSLTLMPENYYRLADNGRMKVSSGNLPIADVAISFTDDFYADPDAVALKYAIPFRLTDTSLDSIIVSTATSVVAVKYISTFHGTYYVKGTMSETDAGGVVVSTQTYENADLSKNITRTLSTLSRKELCRAGVGNFTTDVAAEKVKLTMNDDKTVTVGSAGGIDITAGSGSYTQTDETVTITLHYRFTKNAKSYVVDETLIRRQDPNKDLVFEEW